MSVIEANLWTGISDAVAESWLKRYNRELQIYNIQNNIAQESKLTVTTEPLMDNFRRRF